MEPETELTIEEVEKLRRVIPEENLSRYLSNLGRGRDLIDALSEPAGQEFLTRINAKILECEREILNSGGKAKDDAWVRYEVYKGEANWILDRLTKYRADTAKLKAAAAKTT
jgi:hypothetical protein